MRMKAEKIVFVFGAGFSASSGVPTQDKLLEQIDIYYQNNGSIEERSNWQQLKVLVNEVICSDILKFKIEDLFTIFDKCVYDGEAFKGKSTDDMRLANKYLLKCLKSYIAEISKHNFENKLSNYQKYYELARIIIEKRTSYTDDKLALICLNWDDYFERVLTLVQRSNVPFQKTLLDYCTYDNSFSNSGSYTPSILKKAKGLTNLKLLKPHGSVNWGYCPNCGRLYISLGDKIRKKYECIKFCNKKYGKTVLDAVLITPTFLKDIGNQHLISIWQNIGIELSEATKIVFIGYSLRPEDFYFRFQLLKNIDKDASIYVFDYTDKKEASDIGKYKRMIEKRYDSFFQTKTKTKVYVDGWENNIDEIKDMFPV
jgi:hypothetical protein